MNGGLQKKYSFLSHFNKVHMKIKKTFWSIYQKNLKFIETNFFKDIKISISCVPGMRRKRDLNVVVSWPETAVVPPQPSTYSGHQKTVKWLSPSFNVHAFKDEISLEFCKLSSRFNGYIPKIFSACFQKLQNHYDFII